MNILVITPYFPPDLGPSSPLFGMLCEDFNKLGHKVTVITAVPHFPSGITSADFKKRKRYLSVENNINIIRLWVPSGNRNNYFHRLLVFLIYQFEAAFCCLKLQADRCIITNPALETWLPFFVLSVIKKIPVLYCVWDIYPEIGIKTKVFQNGFVIKLITCLENFCLNRSLIIHTLTEEAADLLVKNHHIKAESIFIESPWVDVDVFKPQKSNKPIFGPGLEGKFIILYSGNLGTSQGLEEVLDVAKQLQIESLAYFIFIGDGVAKKMLIEKAANENIKNVSFLPFQPRRLLPEILSSADVCLISLRKDVIEESIPSKAFPIMSSGKSLLVFADPKSPIWKLVSETKSGIAIDSNKKEDLASAIKFMMKNEQCLIEMGNNARLYAINHLDRSVAAKNLLLQISKI